ncbi:hypothetical protein D3C87_787870 [compost metagenome]
MIGVDADRLGQLGVADQVALLAVNRHEELRLGQGQHDPHLFAAGVAGDVLGRAGSGRARGLVDHVRAVLEEGIDHARDGPLIAGDGNGREDHRISRHHVDVLVLVVGDPGEAAGGFALRAGRDDDDLIMGKLRGLVDLEQEAVRYLQEAVLARLLGGLHERAAHQGDLAAVLLGEVTEDLNPVHVGREGRDDDPVLGGGEGAVQAHLDHALRGGEALARGVGGVRQEDEHALFAQLGELVEVEVLAVDGGLVHLPVAGIDDGAGRGMDGDRAGVGNRVRDPDVLDLAAAGVHDVAGFDHDDRELAADG